MEQLAAMHARVVTLRHEPHADFARLTPYGRRVQKALRNKAPHKLADGSVTLELLPGPPDSDTWSACWRVCCVLLLSL